MIKYKANPTKIIEAIVFIANECRNNSLYTVVKTLFYADKYHLQKYGRPVTGDTYIKMAYGPVPSMAYDILKFNDVLPPDLLAQAHGSFSKEELRIVAGRDPNLEIFSQTDIECLSQALTKCADRDFSYLKEETHKEVAWIEASMNGELDFELLIDKDVPDREELIEYIKETAACAV